jgi:putative sterol carrier protein
MPSLREMFSDLEGKLKARPQKTAGHTVSYQFNIEGTDGGVWTLKIVEGTPEVSEGPAERPDMACTMSVEDYVALAKGQVSGRDLFFSGRMQVEGNAMLGILLGQMLG